MIKSWSHSRMTEFAKCNFRAYLLYDQRIPEPERPLPPGKTEHANDRGTRIHNNCEDFVSGKTDQLDDVAARHFGINLCLLRMLYKEGAVSLEGEWGMSRDWEPAPFKDAWLRMKLDAMVMHSRTHATVIDYKTGRKFGNEIKHAEQLQLYTLTTFLRYPMLEEVSAELWYFDQNETTTVKFTRAQALRFKPNFTRQGLKITEATQFPPRPNVFSCQYCQYGPWGTGHCQVGVRK